MDGNVEGNENNVGNKAIEKLSMMIIKYRKYLQKAGIDITASEGGNNVVNINDNEDNMTTMITLIWI